MVGVTTLGTIQDLMAARFALRREELAADRPLRSLGVDSLAVTEFMFDLEDEFRIRLPYEHANINTLQDILDVIERLMAEQHGRSG